MARYKALKSVAHNFGQSFVSLVNYTNNDYFMNYLLRNVRNTTVCRLEINILESNASPEILLTHEVRETVKMYCKWFAQFVRDCGASIDFISNASMVVEFNLTISRPCSFNAAIIETPFVCETIIEDNRGKKYSYTHKGWWFVWLLKQATKRYVTTDFYFVIRKIDLL